MLEQQEDELGTTCKHKAFEGDTGLEEAEDVFYRPHPPAVRFSPRPLLFSPATRLGGVGLRDLVNAQDRRRRVLRAKYDFAKTRVSRSPKKSKRQSKTNTK